MSHSAGWRIEHGDLLHAKSTIEPSGRVTEKCAAVASAKKQIVLDKLFELVIALIALGPGDLL